MTITVGTDVYINHDDAYTYHDNHGNSTWTGKYQVITAIVTHGDGIKITVVGHGHEVNDSVTVVETTNYNATADVVTVVDVDNFTVATAYVSDETSGYCNTEALIKAQEVALRKATEWIDNHPNHKGNWKGDITSTSQVLSHPRTGLYDEEGRSISSSAYAPDLTEACSIMANKIIEDTEDIFPDISGDADGLKKKRIDVIEKEWFSPSDDRLRKRYDKVDQLLSGLLSISDTSKTIYRTY